MNSFDFKIITLNLKRHWSIEQQNVINIFISLSSKYQTVKTMNANFIEVHDELIF